MISFIYIKNIYIWSGSATLKNGLVGGRATQKKFIFIYIYIYIYIYLRNY